MARDIHPFINFLWSFCGSVVSKYPQEIVGHCDLLIIHCGLFIGNEVTTMPRAKQLNWLNVFWLKRNFYLIIHFVRLPKLSIHTDLA